jgi:hypothetical protein
MQRLTKHQRFSRSAAFLRKAVKWYLGLNQSSVSKFRDLIRVAIHSASIHTDLRPHLMFDGEDGEFTQEMRSLGLQIIFNQIPKIETVDEIALYTDCDVMFTGPLDLERGEAKRLAAAA